MGQRREEVRELARKDPAFYRALVMFDYGHMDYETAVETLLIHKYKEAEALRLQLIDRLSREGPPPIYISGDDITAKIVTPISQDADRNG